MIPKQEMDKLIDFYHLFNAPTQFAIVEKLDGMRFIIHSKENCGHNRGHVHIESSGAEIEIDLQSFEIINMSGKMNNHKKKLAVKFVQENQKMFIDYWNEFSNGVKITA